MIDLGSAALGLLGTALVLGIRHGFDWDHIAAIADITSTTSAGDAAEIAHQDEHAIVGHRHAHGGPSELRAHGGPGAAAATLVTPGDLAAVPARRRFLVEQRHAIFLGTLYALGHALVVALLGSLALLFGAVLPDWVDPLMGRVVGLTLVVLGVWVFVSLYQYARYGRAFRLRSRWMLVFDSVRHVWRRFQAWLHGHEHAAPIEMSSYGPRTAFGVGMIHGIGAETGSQVLLIAAIGGASNQGLGVPMMLAFIAGLLVSNTLVVVLSATSFIASQVRERLYLAIGVLAGTFSLALGLLFLLELEAVLPDLAAALGFLGGG